MSGKTVYGISLILFIGLIFFIPWVKKQWQIEDAIIIKT